MHSLLIGMTGCGKTTLALSLVSYTRRSVLMFDPHAPHAKDALPAYARRQQVDFVTYDPDHFLKVFDSSRNCDVIIDEAGMVCRVGSPEWQKTVTQGRHLGHNNFYLTQHYTAIAPIFRANCATVYAFRQGATNSRRMADDYGCESLRATGDLEQYEYLMLNVGDSEATKWRLDLDTVA